MREIGHELHALRSVSESELVNSVPRVWALTRYTLNAPDRLAWSTSMLRTGQPPQFEDGQVQIGSRQWIRAAATEAWQPQPPASTLPFSMPSWFAWTNNAEMVRLLDIERTRHGEAATIALMDPGAPAWQTLRVDLTSGRVLSTHLISPGHSQRNRFSDFNSAPRILLPSGPGA